jgi:Tfp pilus assembly protein PilN
VRELEFLPEEYLRARLQRRIGFIRSWLLLALGMAMVLWSLQMDVWVRDAKAELESLRGTDSAVEADVEKVRLLRAEAWSYTRRVELLRTLRPQQTATDVVATLADLVPEGLVLDDVRFERSGKAGSDRMVLRLAGTAPSETAVTRTLAALEASPAFERAVLVESKPAAREEAGRRLFVVEVDATPTPAAKE